MRGSNDRAKSTLGRHVVIAASCCGLLMATLALLALSQPWSMQLDVGGLIDGPYLRGFYGYEYNQETRFRWSRPEAALMLPGAGPLAPLGLRVHGGAQGESVELDLGAGPAALALRPGWQRLLLLPRPGRWSGDLEVAIRTPTKVSQSDPRERGLVLDQISLSGQGASPPLGQAALLGASAGLAALLAGWLSGRAWVATLVGIALALVGGAVLALDAGRWRLLLTSYSGRLLLGLVLGGTLALAVEHMFKGGRRSGRLHDTGLPPASRQRLLPPASPLTRRGLAAAALLTFMLRFGAMAYPLTFISDLRFNLGRAWMVRNGKFLDLFLPNPGLTPVQWGSNITVPRTPFYYLLMSPVTFLPGAGAELAMMAFSSAVDALAAMLVAAFVLHVGGGGRAAIVAATLAGSLPFGLLTAVSWGIFPTLLGQCLALGSMLLWLRLRPWLHQRRFQGLLAVAMALAYLAYPATLLFLGTSWALLLLLLLLRRDPAAGPTLRAGLLAAAVALLLYYGWHLPALVSTSLPRVFGALSGGVSLRTDDEPNRGTPDAAAIFWQPLDELYGPLIMMLAAGGALLLVEAARQKKGGSSGDTGAAYGALVMLAWCAIYPIFALFDLRVNLIEKHVLFLLPAMALLAGLLAGRWSRYPWGRVVVAALLTLVLWQGLLLEFDRIVYAYVRLR